jgi:hypothetical protein
VWLHRICVKTDDLYGNKFDLANDQEDVSLYDDLPI